MNQIKKDSVTSIEERFSAHLSSDLIGQHKFLQQFAAGVFNRKQLARFATLWLYITRQHKHAMLSLVHHPALTKQDVASILANLNEEYGNGDFSQSHEELLLRFVKSVDGDPEPKGGHIPAAIHSFVVDTHHSFDSCSPIARVVSHLFVLEWAAAIIYPRLLEGLRECRVHCPDWFSEEEMKFFTLHAEHEVEHAEASAGMLQYHLERGYSISSEYEEWVSYSASSVSRMLSAFRLQCFVDIRLRKNLT